MGQNQGTRRTDEQASITRLAYPDDANQWLDFDRAWSVADVAEYWETSDMTLLLRRKVTDCHLDTEYGSTLTRGADLTQENLALVSSDLLVWLADWLAAFVTGLQYPDVRLELHGCA